jgi:predicted MFS family arabinose efflux permease
VRPERARLGGAARAWRRRLSGRSRPRLFGSGPFSYLRQTHAFSSAGDACFAVSLAGSLFFSVPLTAARPKIMLYLLLTVVPFAVVAPLIGPVVDRYRGGHRVVMVSVCAARGVLCVAMAGQLNTLLVYPEALGVLALSKVYSVAKTALVPGLVPNTDALVDANSRLSRVSALAGAFGAMVGAGVTYATGASEVLIIAAALFGVGAVVASRLPRPNPGVSVSRALEYEEIHAPAPMMAAAAMGVLRAGIGFMTFLLAFALREAGEPPWFFGFALAAGGVGGFAGTYVASRLRRSLHEEEMLALALVVPALFILAAGIQVGRASVLGAALSLGLGASIGRQAFDSLIQHKAPDATRGRLMARFETGFQLAWAAGALVPVALRPPTWVGLLAIASMLIVGSVAYITGAHTSLRFEPEAMLTRLWVHRRLETAEAPLEAVILLHAEEDAARGAHRLAVVEATAACEVLMERLVRQSDGCRREGLGPTDFAGSTIHDVSESRSPGTSSSSLLRSPREWQELEQMRTQAACADHELTSDESDHAIAVAGRLMELLRLEQRELPPTPAGGAACV